MFKRQIVQTDYYQIGGGHWNSRICVALFNIVAMITEVKQRKRSEFGDVALVRFSGHNLYFGLDNISKAFCG